MGYKLKNKHDEEVLSALFKSKEKFEENFKNACNVYYGEKYKNTPFIVLVNTDFSTAYFGNYFKIQVSKDLIEYEDMHPDAVYAREYEKSRNAWERMTPEQRKQYYS